ncbi:MAG: T9SS type A sorting domain-containing protein [Bacteroidota bacterium]
MKKVFNIITFVLLANKIYSQASILSLTVSPASPTTNDYVKVYADCMFTSGGCSVFNTSFYTSGNDIEASAEHCVGMLSVICGATDTFNLGNLSAGIHRFRLTLNVGYGGPPCSPGIVPDDIDTLQITVSPATGIVTWSLASSQVSMVPNPMNESTTIQLSNDILMLHPNIVLYDALGRVVREIKSVKSTSIIIEREKLKAGIYFVQILHDQGMMHVGKLIIE